MRSARHSGFTLIEILVVIAIFLALLGVSLYSYFNARSSAPMKPIADGIVFTLERAKADALAGKNGSGAGVYFASSSYTYFSGDSYDPSASDDQTTTLPSEYVINYTLLSGSSIVFSHLTGSPNASTTITVTDTENASNTKIIGVGTDGDITVIQ